MGEYDAIGMAGSVLGLVQWLSLCNSAGVKSWPAVLTSSMLDRECAACGERLAAQKQDVPALAAVIESSMTMLTHGVRVHIEQYEFPTLNH